MSERRAFAPAHPDWARRVRDSFARQGAMALLGTTIDDLTPGTCAVAAAYRRELSQQNGTVSQQSPFHIESSCRRPFHIESGTKQLIFTLTLLRVPRGQHQPAGWAAGGSRD